MPGSHYDCRKNPFEMNCTITKEDLRQGTLEAIEGHRKNAEVIAFLENMNKNIEELYPSILDGSYVKYISYRRLYKTNNDGKKRNIDSPSFITRIFQHTIMLKLQPYYEKYDQKIAYNCKDGYGITSSIKEKSLMHKLKHIYFDLRQYQYCLIIDQRKCYAHISISVFRKMLKRIISDQFIIDFGVNVCMYNGHLPIGTPTSPFAHHIIMLDFDKFIKNISEDAVRFADDVFIPFETKEEAQQAKWRIKNYWWYELKMRAKRSRTIIQPLIKPCDFCGDVYHRNILQGNWHNKGYVKIRKNTAAIAKKTNNDKTWGSYFGLLKDADCYSLMINIERKMKLKNLTEKIKINRSLDAKNTDVKSIEGKNISIIDYEIRQNKGVDNWIKCLIGVEEIDNNNKPTGKILAREFHGNYQGIIQFIRAVEKEYSKEEILPLEDAVIINQCGYIFKDSTNQLKYIEND